MKHLLSIESLRAEDIHAILDHAATLKATGGRAETLRDQIWGLIFSKSSTRTRVSFEVGLRQLGGDALFLSANDIQLGRGEPIRDTARVLGRMIHGAVIRTFAQSDVEEFARYSGIPTINALTDEEHPCQILCDLLTIQELRGSCENLTLAFVGDADCNVARSWAWAAERLNLRVRLVGPPAHLPPRSFLGRLPSGRVTAHHDLHEGVRGVDILYTDVFVSMGKEAESAERLATLAPYRLDAALHALAAPHALVLHCLPAYRGKEITEELLETHADTIFHQAGNRLHGQKGIVQWLME